MARNLHSIFFQGAPGWSMKTFLHVSARIREFVPDLESHVFVSEEPTDPATDDPQLVFAHQETLRLIERKLSSGQFKVYRRGITADEMAEMAIWCYPTHLPQPGDGDLARLAQMHGAIPIFNPIGVLAEHVFAGVALYGIPVLDPLVQMRYIYETIQFLTNEELQESIRVPMMKYANSHTYQTACDSAKIDGWMSIPELEWLIDHSSMMDNVAEIGCWKGRTTAALAKSCHTVYAIDHWQGGKDEPQHIKDAAANDRVFNEFMTNMEPFDHVMVVKSPSVEAAAVIDDAVIDMCFIDGGHGYDDVVADIRAWLPKTRRLICGHDYDFPDVPRAVADAIGDVERGPGSIWFKWVERMEMKNAAD